MVDFEEINLHRNAESEDYRVKKFELTPSIPDGIFSPRQVEIVKFKAKGMSDREIGDELGISIESIKTYIHGKGSVRNGILATARDGVDNRYKFHWITSFIKRGWIQVTPINSPKIFDNTPNRIFMDHQQKIFSQRHCDIISEIINGYPLKEIADKRSVAIQSLKNDVGLIRDRIQEQTGWKRTGDWLVPLFEHGILKTSPIPKAD